MRRDPGHLEPTVFGLLQVVVTMKRVVARGGPKTTVFVIGAGFSHDLGYPLTYELLKQLRMKRATWTIFRKVVKFHHPDWDGRKESMPDIETLLTEWVANEELLPTLRPNGPFTAEDLRGLRRDLLGEISDWFHKIHKRTSESRRETLTGFARLVSTAKNPVIISFNWDYELDRLLCEGRKRREVYGLEEGSAGVPVLLKPHGSLNWYRSRPGRHIKVALRETLWEDKNNKRNVRYCFLNWRAPRSSRRRYIPWIVPPTYFKSFEHDMLRTIWRRCVDSLSVANEVFFLGYSLPAADWHSRYIFRCGFHNQLEGRPLDHGGREKSTGRARVHIVNPDETVRNRVEATAGFKCQWFPGKVRKWLSELA